MNDFSGLPAEKKRAMLVKLLQEKGKGSKIPAPNRQSPNIFEQFTLTTKDLAVQADLDPGIKPVETSTRPPLKTTNLLLTGATGFLGAFLLYELLTRTDQTIYCLVRCKNAEDGKNRIESNLSKYLPPMPANGPRIVPVPGDLSQPLLGLSERQFNALADRIGTIYHNGAAVNWIYSFNRLKAVNVQGTREVLRLVCRGPVKNLHYISSFSIFPLTGNPQGKIVYEEDSLDHNGILYGGYIQTKWAAEKMVSLAKARGIPVTIYRPGIISGHSQTGAWNASDFMPRLIKSWVELGSAPDLDGAIDLTPVDYVSRSIAHLSLTPGTAGQAYHLVNPKKTRIRDLTASISAAGYPLKTLPYDQWRKTILSSGSASGKTAVQSLMPLFSKLRPEQMPETSDQTRQPGDHSSIDRIGSLISSQYLKEGLIFDDRNTRRGLAGTSLACPPVDQEVITNYLAYFASSGYLGAPNSY